MACHMDYMAHNTIKAIYFKKSPEETNMCKYLIKFKHNFKTT